MFSAINKTLLGAMLLMLSLASCGNKEREDAMALYAESEQAIAAGNYSDALVLLDTLNSRYSYQTQIRRDALRLRAMAMQGLATDSISAGSEALAVATISVEELRPGFRHVDSSVGLEGYFIPKGAAEKVMTTTGIQPRVSDKGFFYIVANVQGKAIGFNYIEFVDGTSSISSSAISSARVVKVEGSESISLNPEDIEGVGAWVLDHPSFNKAVLHGTKGSVTVKIDDKLRKQIADCHKYSEALQAQRLASLKREKYERMLATARDQLANLPQPEEKK